MTLAVRIHRHGGPDVLQLEQIDLPLPGDGYARIRQTAIGLNFIDTYFRTGVYKIDLPAGIGSEAAGVIDAVGPRAEGFKPGDRVAYVMIPGAYAEAVNIPVSRLVKLPDEVSDESAAAILLKGMTAEYLLHRTYKVTPGQTILVHAAAGGTGSLLCQWASHLGARVIGVVSTEAKVATAKAMGCADVVVAGRGEPFTDQVRALTKGVGVPVIYDSVGKDTFFESLDCLKTRGMLVSFGNSSGVVTGIDLSSIAKGSFFVTRPGLAAYIGTRTELEDSAKAVFSALASGALRVAINQRYRLTETATAHRDLEGRKTTGASVILP